MQTSVCEAMPTGGMQAFQLTDVTSKSVVHAQVTVAFAQLCVCARVFKVMYKNMVVCAFIYNFCIFRSA